MKIVFVEPASKEANVYSKLRMPLLGPLYLGTILKNRGHEVEVYHEDIFRPDYSRLKADILGISILTSTAKRGYQIAGSFPKEKVIIGGVHASLMPQEAKPYCRQVVVGEAENVIVSMVEGGLQDEIVYGTPVGDLDTLPQPDFSLIKGYNQSASIVPISTSRGCPFDCTFCSVTKIFGRKYRFRSTSNVMRELLSRQGSKFFFCDDNFTAHPKRTSALLEEMLPLKIRDWVCQVRCDVTKNEKLLSLLAKAGCAVVCVGFESVNIKTLEVYQKKQTLEDIINAIRSFRRKKIRIHGMFVLGSDNDNESTAWETLRFAIKQKIDTIQMMILTPFPGTKVHEQLQAQKRIFSHDWSLYDGQHVVFKPKLLSARQLQLGVINAYSSFYSLTRAFTQLLRMRFTNALFGFMGHKIIKEWIGHNRAMKWLVCT
jgi:radical SAM superfamily enzyme YgiQ (UPF0313 family)